MHPPGKRKPIRNASGKTTNRAKVALSQETGATEGARIYGLRIADLLAQPAYTEHVLATTATADYTRAEKAGTQQGQHARLRHFTDLDDQIVVVVVVTGTRIVQEHP